MVAVTRISGIIYGVILTMIMSVLVFPKSASHQATDNLKAGLEVLAELNTIVWKRQDSCTAALDILQPATVAEECTDGCLPAYRESARDVEACETEGKALLEEGVDQCCDKVCLTPWIAGVTL